MPIDRGTLRAALAVVVSCGLIGTLHLVRTQSSGALDFPCSQGGEEVPISVSTGESGSSIATQLEKSGVVQSRSAFYQLAVSDERSASIAPGVHRISTRLCASDALTQLLDSSRIENLLTIIEGEWNREIVKSLISHGYAKAEVAQAVARIDIPSGYQRLEGLLFPAQYSFSTDTSLSEILAQIVKRGLTEIKSAGISQNIDGFTPAQLLTIASLIQAEGNLEDYSKISQVIRNRLTKGMPLQFDSTVHYIKGTRGSMFLSTQSTYLNSPYNTYRHYGLPPAPINNPGSAAMRAAATPTSGNWLYFITVGPGDTRFTDNLDEFNTWKALYKKNLRSGKFGSS